MNKLSASLPAKVLAILLITAAALALGIGCTAFVMAQAEGYYSGEMPGPDSHPAAHMIYDLRNRLPLICLGLLLLFVLLLVFLLSSAGHRRGREGILPNFMDRIPLDVYIVGVICLVTLFLSGAVELGYYLEISDEKPWGNAFFVTCFLGLLGLAFLSCLMALMSLATRFKLGKCWRNSLIYRACRWLWRLLCFVGQALRDSFHSIPLVWKSALVYAAGIFIFLLLALESHYSSGASFLLVLCCLLLFGLLCSATLQMQKLKKAGAQLSAGNLEYRTDTARMYRGFKEHGENLNSISLGMSRALEERMKSERLKTELITNVSHDLKTPLTSIINYTDLLQKEPLSGNGAEYAAVLARQAARLKKLTDDLFYAAKTQAGAIPVEKAPTNLTELCNQALAEYGERFAARGLTAVFGEGPEVRGLVDGRLLWRVLDNLFSNVCKYAQPGTRVYIDLKPGASCTVKNVSQNTLNIPPEELMERFVRGDSARSTEGSGLGLNIARSLMEMMGGSLELVIDGDLFKAILHIPGCG